MISDWFWGHQPAENGERIYPKAASVSGGLQDFGPLRKSGMEQFMMYTKAELFEDEEIRAQILDSRDPKKQIKALGRKVRIDQTLGITGQNIPFVLNGSWYKFSQNRALRDFPCFNIRDSVLAEASPLTAFGDPSSAASPEARDPLKWRGRKPSGLCNLMEVRDELRRVTRVRGAVWIGVLWNDSADKPEK